MTLSNKLQHRIRASKGPTELEEALEDADASVSHQSISSEDGDLNSLNESEIGSRGGETQSEEEEDDRSTSSSPSTPDPQELLARISFGALASAQDSITRKRKRSSSPSSHPNNNPQNDPFPEAFERRAGKKDKRLHSRNSKHAPTELSSKKAVSRKRSIIPNPALASRDPRFEPLSGALDPEKFKRNYAFLADYRASETAALKAAIRNTKDQAQQDRLKRELRSTESQEKTRAEKDTHQAIVREHRKKEKDAIGQGKKPYYLKRGELKRLALVKKFEGLGEKKVERVIERRRKKKAASERREMPLSRRRG